MDKNAAIHFPLLRQIVLSDQNRHIMGGGISFLIHAVGVCCIIFASSALSSFTPPLVIDFSIEKSDGGAAAKKAVAKVVRKKNHPAPQIKQVPPAPQPLPEKVKVAAIPKKTEPVLTKKVVVAKEEPKQIETVEVEEPPPDKIIPEKIVASTKPMDDNLDKLFKENDAAPAAGPIVAQSPSLPKKQYRKEHFLYIKESVQNKITYPHIARKMGWQGRVLVSFVICRDGSVKDIRVVESSGFKALDNNAIKAIQKVAPFPKPPVAAELTIPVIYKLS